MRVLSIKEPFASLIANNIKKIETRSWKTNYRGEIYIHASLTMTSKKKLENRKELQKLVNTIDTNPGYILCKANLKDCIYMTKDFINEIKKNHKEYICGHYEIGRYAWILDDIEILKDKIKAKGKLGIWYYSK